MAAKKKAAKSKRSNGLGGAPEGYSKVETHLVGFWRPTIEGQSVNGTVGEPIDVRGADGKINQFYSLTLISDQGGPIKDKDDKTIPTVPGQMIGIGGKMLLVFLRGREGKDVYLQYIGLGKAKPGQSAPKLFATFQKDEDE